MKDWLFYPLIIAFAGAMIAYALSLAEYENVDLSEGFIVEGRALSTFYASQGTTFSIAGDNVNPFAYAVLSAHVSRKNAPPSAGIFITLGPEDKKIFSDKNLRITVHARKGRANPLDSFDVAYFSQGAGSGWKSFELSNEFQDYSFVYKTGKADLGKNDYVGLWPDVAGQGRTMDIKWLKIELANKAAP